MVKVEEKVCSGCTKIEKPFWSDTCPIKTCCEEKELACCGECDTFPYDLLKSFAYDKEQGDNELHIENCKEWCKEN